MTIQLSRSARWLLVLVGLGVLVTLALWLIDFGIQPRSDVSVQGQPVFVGLRQGEHLPAGGPVRVRVRGGGPLATALKEQLPEALKAEAPDREVAITEVITERLAVALLDVRLARAAGFWTPLLARSEVTLEAAYSSDGDPSWLAQGDGRIAASADPVARLRIQVDGRYGASGLLSRRGYYRAVAASLAQSLARELASQLERG